MRRVVDAGFCERRGPRAPPLLLLGVLCSLAVTTLRTPARADAGPFQNPMNGHWYEAVAVPGAGITFANARTAAEARSHMGRQGYLASLTSSEESEWVVTTFPS